MAPKLVLTYFDFAGAAESVRWALEQSGLEWEDKRISGEEFVALKPSECSCLEVVALPPASTRFTGRRLLGPTWRDASFLCMRQLFDLLFGGYTSAAALRYALVREHAPSGTLCAFFFFSFMYRLFGFVF